MTDADYVAYEQPRNRAPLVFIPLVGVIAVAAGMWLTGGVVVDGAAILLLVGLTLFGFWIFSRASRDDPEDALFQVLILAWLTRLVGMGVKLYLFYAVVGGATDAAAYHVIGTANAEVLRTGHLPQYTQFWGTEFVELVTGFMYFVTGPTFVGSWIVFNFLAMLGMLLQYKAFVTAVYAGHRRLFILLIFFAPTLVMWTDSLGKDALMAFFLGMVSYGVATLYRRGLGLSPLLWILWGLGGAMLTRPHIGAIVAVALTGAVLMQPVRAGMLTPFLRIGMIAAVVALAFFVVRTSASYINLDDLSVEGVTGFIQEEGQSTEQGSLAFEGGGFPTTPRAVGLAVLTVLFRPFPWEASSLLIRITSLEGIGLMGLLLYRIRSVWRAIWGAPRSSYLVFVVIFVVIFIIALSPISNFGILIRQRAQVLPFLFIWLAFQDSSAGTTSDPDDSADTN